MGVFLCLLSAAGFGTMAIFGKLAYEEQVSVLTLLVVRFAIAAVVLAPLAAWRARRVGHRDPGGASERRRLVRTALALGAVGYATQAGLFFAALERIDASLLALLLYSYPALVTIAAIALGREPATRRRLGALALASSGVVLVLGGAAHNALDPLAVAMALASAVTYTAYILVADRVVAALPALTLSALVAAGAAATFLVLGLVAHRLEFALSAQAWLWLALIGIVSTVMPVVSFFAGMARVGPSSAAILSTFEPPVTVALAFVVFGERLTALQLAGAALVLGAVLVLQVPARRLAVPEPVVAGTR